MGLVLHSTSAAVFEHLTGASRGHVTWMMRDQLWLWLNARGQIFCAGDAPEDQPCIARVSRHQGQYRLTALAGPLWVNRIPATQTVLHHGDTVEFGEHGPISRFRIFDERQPAQVSLGLILGDARSYLRSSRRPVPQRIARAGAAVLRRVVLETRVLFRLGVLAALTLLTFLVWAQYRTDRTLRARIDSGALQVDSMAGALAQARQQAIAPKDLAALRADLAQHSSATASRLNTLEAQAQSGPQVIGAARMAVAFLQGAYGLRHRDTGQMLRMVSGPDGQPRHLPNGQPLLSLAGTGPVAEVQFNGTGFVLAGRDLIVTNRHVARPWEQDDAMALGSDQLEPVMIRFLAYLPGQGAPLDVTVHRLSEAADLAVLVADGDLPEGLPLAPQAPRLGSEVIVMGYPTGLSALLAQAGSGFIDQLKRAGDTGFFDIARELARAGRIAPLSSQGIIAQITETTVVYDAETTRGGSGGPVLDRAGRVVAVNTAILPEFGGSNLGVPVSLIQALLEP